MRIKRENLKTEFINYLRSGEKPIEAWRVGVEIELFGFDAKTLQRIENEQVRNVLQALATSNDDLVFEDDLLVELQIINSGKWTIEPGGQLEFSSAARKSLIEIEKDLTSNLIRLQQIGEQLNIKFLALGFDPLRKIDEQNWYLKPRYEVMKPALAAQGSRAWDMMTRTCAVQVNLDYSGELDLARKFIVSNQLAPIVAAIFANSPFIDGEFNNCQSNRALTWLDTDPTRSGISPLALKDDFSYAAFVEYALDVPLLFIKRNDRYLNDFTSKTFRQFLKYSELEPHLEDFQNHLTAIFTEARLKKYLEIRSADGGNLNHALSVAALWKGLLYDETSLQAAFELAPQLNADEFRALQKLIAKNGLRASSDQLSVLELAKKTIVLASEGLARIAPNETKFLDLLRNRVLIEERSSADVLLDNWCGKIEKVFELTELNIKL